MQFWKLSPEVPAELGDHTALDSTVHPPAVRTLHLMFVGWPESQLISCFPCFAVTKALAEILVRAECSGFELAQLKVTLDEQLEERHANRRLPPFVWPRVVGTALRDDFGVGDDHGLVVSARALAILRPHLVGCEHRRAGSTPDPFRRRQPCEPA